MRNAVGDDARLTTACSSEQQQGTFDVRNRFSLLRI
jgi:hypothetical protein